MPAKNLALLPDTDMLSETRKRNVVGLVLGKPSCHDELDESIRGYKGFSLMRILGMAVQAGDGCFCWLKSDNTNICNRLTP
jgi:hypothetical protein